MDSRTNIDSQGLNRSESENQTGHANRHVPKFLKLPQSERGDVVQLISDGKTLTSERLLQNKDIVLSRPILIEDTPESIGMKVLRFPKREVSVRDVADIIGHEYPVHVIDVEHQEELEGWTLTDLVDYFEDEERLLLLHQQEVFSITACLDEPRRRRRRKAAERCLQQSVINRPRVLNQISLEFSRTPLIKKIQSPQFVRDLDWIDHAWPRQQNRRPSEPEPEYPNVQYYCLTSAAGCYTDFHIDFGGTAVWYHILNGQKTFCLIPPTKKYLKVYEDWLCRPDQAEVFLPDLIDDKSDVLRISLKASQTLIIPTAWIHAVYTPVDSLVLGGNFLHGLDIPLQLQVHCIETRTRVQEKFRFPFFLPVNFYAGGMYLKKLRAGTIRKGELEGLPDLIHALEEWWKVQNTKLQVKKGPTAVSAAKLAASNNNCDSVDDFLAELRKEYTRVHENGISRNPLFSSSISPSNKPKLRLKLPVTNEPTTSSSSNEGKFRIVVSSSAGELAAPVPVRIPKKKKKSREDTEWYVEEGADVDTEWMPSSSRRKRSLSIPKKSSRKLIVQGVSPSRNEQIALKTVSNSQTTHLGVKRQKTKTGAARPSAKPKTTARQRLMKRFR